MWDAVPCFMGVTAAHADGAQSVPGPGHRAVLPHSLLPVLCSREQCYLRSSRKGWSALCPSYSANKGWRRTGSPEPVHIEERAFPAGVGNCRVRGLAGARGRSERALDSVLRGLAELTFRFHRPIILKENTLKADVDLLTSSLPSNDITETLKALINYLSPFHKKKDYLITPQVGRM